MSQPGTHSVPTSLEWSLYSSWFHSGAQLLEYEAACHFTDTCLVRSVTVCFGVGSSAADSSRSPFVDHTVAHTLLVQMNHLFEQP